MPRHRLHASLRTQTIHESQHHRRRRFGRLLHGVRLANGPHRPRDCACRRQCRTGRRASARSLARSVRSWPIRSIHSGGYEQIPDSDLICITAGLRRKPDESRLDLINRNVDLFVGILGEIQQAPATSRDAIVLVVSNPVDVLTYLAAERLDLPPAASHRSGDAARYDPLSQPDRRATWPRRRRKSRR